MLQIENREDEYNPYVHSPQDNIAHMNLDYWVEQIKATIAATAHLAVPITSTERVYLPLMSISHGGDQGLSSPNSRSPSHPGYQSRPDN